MLRKSVPQNHSIGSELPFQPGHKHSPEAIERIKAAVNARWSNPEYREKQRQKHTGFKHTEKSKNKMSAAKIGKPQSEETKAKISKALKGRQLSREACLKLCYAQRARIFSENFETSLETRQKMSEIVSGTKWWNNGTENKHCRDWPGEGWVPGRFRKRKKEFLENA